MVVKRTNENMLKVLAQCPGHSKLSINEWLQTFSFLNIPLLLHESRCCLDHS